MLTRVALGVKALALEHPDLTREKLVKLAETLPGAWMGIRIAGFLLLLHGWRPTEICELFGFSRTALWKWVGAANQSGLAAWREQPRPGRTPRLTPDQQQQLELALGQSPERFGFAQTRWDGPLVVSYLKQVLNVKLEVRQAQRWLHRLDFVLLQPTYRYVQAKKRGVAQFGRKLKKNLRQALASAGHRVVLFADEAGFALHPKLGRVWAKKGSQPVVLTRSQHRQRLNLFGWVNPLTGERGLMKAAQGNTVAFLAFLKGILITYPAQLIHLWVDNASWHKGDQVVAFLKANPRLKLIYHPPYHPELNCQEPIWKRIRYEITTNRYRSKLEQLEREIFNRVTAWSNEKVKSFCVAKCKLT